ncbi:MAG: EcsC family protein [Planctomycetales bacterium]|nr:EcsC family protein [Planctomycetales bacterium]
MHNEKWTDEDLKVLKYAKSLLENPGLAARIASAFGTPVEWVLTRMPDGVQNAINVATKSAIETALKFAVTTMEDREQGAVEWIHKSAVALSGAAGGLFGAAALPIELPISTTIMLRAIADIARSEGEKIATADAQVACIEVFAMGSRLPSDDGANTAYYAAKAAMAKEVAGAAAFLVGGGKVGGPAAPPLIALIATVAERFGVVVSEKVVAQGLPVIGAVGGAIINTMFIDHFQNMARGHFIVRRLERKFGSEDVERKYNQV